MNLHFRWLGMLLMFFLPAACSPTVPSAVAPTPQTPPNETAALDALVADLTAAGAVVVNDGRTTQGFFPASDIDLWHLRVNDDSINVFVFTGTAAREGISSGISVGGYELILRDGDTTMVTHWDGAGTPRFWAQQNLIINYWGDTAAVLEALRTVLGAPIADGSLPYRPEPHSGAVAGFSEHGVSLQYDPYLAGSYSVEIVPARPSAVSNGALPTHIAITFQDTYAADFAGEEAPEFAAPQILVIPRDAYAQADAAAADRMAPLADSIAADGADLLPYLPQDSSAQISGAQVVLLAFQNGAGFRYLTPDQSGEVEQFVFQGLTTDGRYLVAGFFPVQRRGLPDEAFVPDLALLDELFASLQVMPALELNGSATETE